MKKILFISIYLILCCSCKLLYMPRNFKYCCTKNGDNKADLYINFDGYYITEIPKGHGMDTISETILFYKDGSCASTPSLANWEIDSTHMKSMLENPELNILYWGGYKIVDDSVFYDMIYEESFWNYYMVYGKLKIVDKNTLQGVLKIRPLREIDLFMLIFKQITFHL